MKAPFAIAVSLPEEGKGLLRATLKGRPQDYLRTWTNYDPRRGMSHWHDIIDWVGGYPYEVAKVDRIFDFYRERGFSLQRLAMDRGLGCNEFVFTKADAPQVRVEPLREFEAAFR